MFNNVDIVEVVKNMRKEKIKKLVMLLLLLLFPAVWGCKFLIAGNQNPSQIGEVILERWPDQCRALKSKWLKQSGTGIVYSSIPKDKVQLPLWSLQLEEQEFPIIPAQYTKVEVTYDAAHNQYSIILFSSKSKFISIGPSVSEEPLLGWDSGIIDPKGNPEDVYEWTLTALEPPPRTIENLHAMALKHKPDDLSCLPEASHQEMRIASALHTKSIFSGGNLVRAYSFPQQFMSWLTLAETDEYMVWKAYLAKKEKPGYFMSMRTPKSSAFKDIGLSIHTQGKFSRSSNQPQWLTNLQVALEKDKPENWKTLSDSLKSADIESNSVKELSELK